MEKKQQSKTVTMMRVRGNDMKMKWNDNESSITDLQRSKLIKICLSSLSLTHAFSTPKIPNRASSKKLTQPKSMCVQCVDDTDMLQAIVGVKCYDDNNDWYILVGPDDQVSVSVLELLIEASNIIITDVELDKLEILWKRLCSVANTIYNGGRRRRRNEEDDKKRFNFILQCIHDLVNMYVKQKQFSKSYINMHSINDTNENYITFKECCKQVWNINITNMKVCIVSPMYSEALSSLPENFQLNRLQLHDDDDDDDDMKVVDEDVILAWYFRWIVVTRIIDWNELDVFVEYINDNNAVCLAVEYRKWRLFAMGSSCLKHDGDNSKLFSNVRHSAQQLLRDVSNL